MSDEPDVYDEPYRGTQILWGRVIVLLLALALAFWLGTTFGGDASAQGDLEQQRQEIARLESEVAELEAEVAAVDAGGESAGGSSSPEPTEDEPTEDEDAAEPTESSDDETGTKPANAEDAASEYVVQSGDSLAAIAQEVYGDPTLWREIAAANDIEAPYSLTVGDTLEVPAEP
jgi:nucleoid-associated protein YgaU